MAGRPARGNRGQPDDGGAGRRQVAASFGHHATGYADVFDHRLASRTALTRHSMTARIFSRFA